MDDHFWASGINGLALTGWRLNPGVQIELCFARFSSAHAPKFARVIVWRPKKMRFEIDTAGKTAIRADVQRHDEDVTMRIFFEHGRRIEVVCQEVAIAQLDG